MAGGQRWRLIAALAGAFIVLSATETRAQSIPLDEAPVAGTGKVQEVTPHKRALIERLIYKLDDDLWLERMLDPPRGVYLRLGRLGEGAGSISRPLRQPRRNPARGSMASIPS
jgi:hypothetical protein